MSNHGTPSTLKHSTSTTRPRRGLAIALAVIMIGAAFVGIAPTAAAQTTAPADCDIAGPDGSGYVCEVASAATWYDLSDGEDVFDSPPDNGVSDPLPLGFTYTWYGQSNDQAYVGSNGILCFSTDDCRLTSNDAPPATTSPNNLLACYWENLAASEGGTIQYATFGTAPDRVFVVELTTVPHWVWTSNTVTFQLQLHENGLARCVYNTVTDDGDGDPTAVGTENSDGTDGLRYTFSEFSATPADGEQISFAVDFDPRPDAPASLTATQDTGTRTIDLDWTHPDGVDGTYNIYLDGTLDGQVSGSTGTTHNVPSDTVCGDALTYEVTALNGDFESQRSDTASVTLSGCPGTPTNVQADGGQGQVSLGWSAPDSGDDSINQYNIYRCTGDGTGACSDTSQEIATGETITATSYTDTDLADGTKYCYLITAENDVGEGDPSTPTCDHTAPAQPTSLTADATDQTVTLTWTPPTGPIDSYTIYRATTTDPDTATYSVTDTSTTTSYQETRPPTNPNHQLCYKVSATIDAAEGDTTPPICSPGPVENLTALPGLRGATLVWTPPATGPQDAQTLDNGGDPITAYHVYRCRLGDEAASANYVQDPSWSCPAHLLQGPFEILVGPDGEGSPATLRTYLDDGDTAPSEAGTYGYRVHAVNDLSEGKAAYAVALILQGSASPVPSPNELLPFLQDNPDGTCTAYNDENENGTAEPEEELATAPCPDPKAHQHPDGSVTVYDDKDDDGEPGPGENVTTTPAPGDVTGDLDGDNVPDAVERELCGRALVRNTINDHSPTTGECVTSTDYDPPEDEKTFFVPNDVSFGPDEDNDEVPSTVTVHRTKVTVRPFNSTVVTTEEAPDQTETLDQNDTDPNTPVQSTFGPVSVPTSASHSGDGDNDYVPGTVTVTWLDVTVDRTQADPVSTDTHTSTTTLDDNDNDRNDPVPFNAFDADGDFIPDAAEPWICQVQNINSPSDGWCGDPDGSDMNDYTPPTQPPNPWDLT